MIARLCPPLGIIVAVALPVTAHAGDKPLYAPAPAWVRPVATPAAAGPSDGAAVHILLSDQQMTFEAGRRTIYSDFVVAIQTPQGLEAGNISLPWDPETDALTIHKLVIRRADKTIDVLAGGQTFTVVRREPNLESAMLDGVLTANIQPEGLEVGDILEFAASVTSSDPVMKGRVEAIAAGWDSSPISRAHLRMQWPSTLKMRLRQSGSLPVLKPVKADGVTSVEMSLDEIEPVPGPKFAPLRYQLGRRVEVTNFDTWADLAALLFPLFDAAAQLPAQGPLADEVTKIRSSSPDPKARAEAALALVQDRIRYVALAMGRGSLVPADVTTTWSRRYGDCKAKTALLIAILKSVGIDAQAVLVSSQLGDGLDERLPMVGAFDHVLVRATIAGRAYWLDGTRKGDTSLDRLTVPNFGWGLPLAPGGSALVRMVPPPLDRPQQSTSIHIDARAGLTLPAPIKVETVFRGDAAIAANMGLANMTPDARDRALKSYWKSEYDFVEPTVVAAKFDPVTGEQRLTLDGKAKMNWSTGWYETDGTAIGYKADFTRDPGPNRDAPFAVAYPIYTRTEEEILLPPGFPDDTSRGNDDVARTVAGVEYRRKSSLSGRVFRVEKTERSLAPEFAAKDAPAAEAALREMSRQTLYLRRPATYQPTDAEVSVLMDETPKTAAAFLQRGNTLLDRGRFDDAIKDFDAALALDPKNDWALADRGMALVWQDKFDAAIKDIDAAHLLSPRNPVVFRARGIMLQKKGDHRAAVDAFTTSLQFDPGNDFALGKRASSYRAIGNDDAALADAAAVIARKKDAFDMYALRANIFKARGDVDKMVAEVIALTTANSDNADAQVLAGVFYASVKRDVDAAKAFDRALAIKPEAYIYINRAEARPATDRAGRLADFDAALKLDAKSTDALSGKAKLLADGGDVPGAIAIYTNAIAIDAKDPGLLVQRGILKFKAGDAPGGERDFVVARALAKNASEFNNMCWAKATAGVALQSALSDCDQALAKVPTQPAYLDSRAFVLLRLNRLDEAISTYDRALAGVPTLAASLFGRAAAWSRKGDRVKSASDLALAVKLLPNVAKTFAGYGVTIDTP